MCGVVSEEECHDFRGNRSGHQVSCDLHRLRLDKAAAVTNVTETLPSRWQYRTALRILLDVEHNLRGDDLFECGEPARQVR